MQRPFRIAAALLATLFLGAQADTLDRRVRVVNDSKHVMVGFYGARVGERDAPENLLGEAPLKAGASTVFDFEDDSGYCRFRFRAVFDDGVEVVRESVNVCEVGTYRYTD